MRSRRGPSAGKAARYSTRVAPATKRASIAKQRDPVESRFARSRHALTPAPTDVAEIDPQAEIARLRAELDAWKARAEAAEAAADHDVLTPALNRRGFVEALNPEDSPVESGKLVASNTQLFEEFSGIIRSRD